MIRTSVQLPNNFSVFTLSQINFTDLEILQKSSSPLKPTQRVVVSIKQRGLIPIKTIYIAEKNRFHPKRVICVLYSNLFHLNTFTL